MGFINSLIFDKNLSQSIEHFQLTNIPGLLFRKKNVRKHMRYTINNIHFKLIETRHTHKH